MRINYIFEDKLFASAILVVTISCAVDIYMLSSNLKNCEKIPSNSLCSFFHLCENVNNFVCDKNPYFQTNTHIAIDGLFIFSLGVLTSYSAMEIFHSYIPGIKSRT
ncbi:MAG: hypothetical protein KR126chlam6_00451 [Candidatus Anoxychlamydiales bacterium]|nr:hypothetical protein [Candidatus Anoxychlamydiales bacterium]